MATDQRKRCLGSCHRGKVSLTGHYRAYPLDRFSREPMQLPRGKRVQRTNSINVKPYCVNEIASERVAGLCFALIGSLLIRRCFDAPLRSIHVSRKRSRVFDSDSSSIFSASLARIRDDLSAESTMRSSKWQMGPWNGSTIIAMQRHVRVICSAINKAGRGPSISETTHPGPFVLGDPAVEIAYTCNNVYV